MSNVAWNDLYFRLWTEAAQSRGTVTQLDHSGGANGLTAIPEWPRTTGADVIAIVQLIDSFLGALPPRPGGYGVARLWQSAVIDVEGVAFDAPLAEYVNNRTLWSALLAVSSYLDTREQPPPIEDDIERLLAQLWSPVDRRNASGPMVRELEFARADKMWSEQRETYAGKRGADVRSPTETGNMQLTVPRTTNADVVRIYEYWASELMRFLILGRGANTMGLEGQIESWNRVRDEVDIARKGKPDEVYAKNTMFWTETRRLATNLGGWDQVPGKFTLVIDSTVQAVKDLPHTLTDVVGTVAKAAGTVAREVGSSFLAGLGKPLLIGGAAVVGLIVVLRLSRAPRPAGA